MKKMTYLMLTLLLALGLFAGCSNDAVEKETDAPKEETSEEVSFPVTVTDAEGEEITIEAAPEKLVSVIPSNTEIAFALGLDDEIVGVSEHDNYPEEAAEKESIGGLELNIEKIISLEPDLVLADVSNDPDGLKQLKEADITVLTTEPGADFLGVYETIQTIGKATGKKEEADTIQADMEAKLKELEERVEAIDDVKSVYVEISPSPETYTVGKGTFIDEILTKINAKNSAGDLEGWPQVNEEAVVEMNPDIIITTYGSYVEDPVKEITDRKAWKDITAVKEEAIIDVNEDLVSRPGPRLVEGAEELAKAIYPDIFAN